MIKNAKESNFLISRYLPGLMDPLLRQHGFRRRGNSHRYLRQNLDAKQRIEIALAHTHNPSCGTVAQVLPYLEFFIPAVNEIALEMVQDPKLLANAPQITLRQQMHIAVPRPHRTTWFYHGEDECIRTLRSVRDSIARWGIPFLDEYSTASAITANYEAGDERVFTQQHWYIYVSAAYLLQNRRSEAKEVLESKLIGFWTRKRFAPAFEYLAQPKLG